jgi:hypothetical protein
MSALSPRRQSTVYYRWQPNDKFKTGAMESLLLALEGGRLAANDGSRDEDT